jgi:hypothetical protein
MWEGENEPLFASFSKYFGFCFPSQTTCEGSDVVLLTEALLYKKGSLGMNGTGRSRSHYAYEEWTRISQRRNRK